jgi:uncharacterized protein
VKLAITHSFSHIPPAAWDALVADGSPFLEWGWLASLEQSDCVSPQTGWQPQHLTLWDGRDLVGACPLYMKGHSQGEFVFDYAWAEAARRCGLPYYPKLLVGVPFTPATGARFLTRPGTDRPGLIRIMANALADMCRQRELSSAHVNFCLPEESALLAPIGFEARTGYQFHWTNLGWQTFDDYLAAFRSKRRNQIKRERQELAAQGVDITVHAGADIPEHLFGTMFQLYKSTVDKMDWGQQYLNPHLFELLRQRWKHRLCFFLARRGGRIIAGTFNVRKNNVLYGRYWGTFEELRFLHFNVCYYAAIEYCLREGISRFEPGAGGEFKYLRGFNACPTVSMHFLSDARLASAVRTYLRKERAAVAAEIGWLEEHSPIRR